MIRRVLSTLSVKQPAFLRSIKGEIVAYPKNACKVYGEHPIATVGVEAVQMIEETHPSDVLRNMAKVNYLIKREELLREYRGYWLVISSNKSLVLVEHEATAKAIARSMFRSKTEDYFMGCLGSEVMSQAFMGSMCLTDEDQENWAKAVYVDGEYSFNHGSTFLTQRMKFGTGACMMGVPKSVTSQYTLDRDEDEFYIGPDGRRTAANTYENVVIRVAGLPVTTRIIECRTWLLGYDVYKNFTCTVDTRGTPPVVMVPHDASF